MARPHLRARPLWAAPEGLHAPPAEGKVLSPPAWREGARGKCATCWAARALVARCQSRFDGRSPARAGGDAGVARQPDDTGSVRTFQGTTTARAEIAHFHSDRSADLHLTAGKNRRFEDNLRGSSAIRLLPDSHWVTIHLECNADIDLLLTLASVALQAHQQWLDTGDASAARCNDRHGGRAREVR
ncbi:luciferase family protein [Streptomyces caniferus]|uniref:luciferase domain-containing protein n=1 Tax=Streptomyces caniferus TaxID=285557 RepID=UPI0034557775